MSMTPDEIARARRNLNPHAEAIAAMYLYSDEYVAQMGGSMDFWGRLSPSRQRVCQDLVAKILEAAKEGKRA